jgi:tRNA (guanine9-N1)-methyltransferase
MAEADEKPKVPAEDAAGPPAKRAGRPKPVVLPGPRIVMDMNWDDQMDDHQHKKVVSQVAMGYSFNKWSAKSLPMLFTSVGPLWERLLGRVSAFQWPKEIVAFTPDSLLDAVPLADLVYLTPDTDNVCTELDPAKSYVIGCFIDHNSKKGATRDFAERHGLRMERLPIGEFISMAGPRALAINHVVEIFVRVANGLPWNDALLQTIPPRKNPHQRDGAPK